MEVFKYMFDFYDFLGWDKTAYAFNRSVKDTYPYNIKDCEDKIVIVHNVVGIKPDDISVVVENGDGRDKLIINGKTHNEVLDSDYTVHSSFRFNSDDFKSIDYHTEDGLLYIELNKRQAKKKQIAVNKK
jgi:HSP20 family molecular chaperone IbpA